MGIYSKDHMGHSHGESVNFTGTRELMLNTGMIDWCSKIKVTMFYPIHCIHVHVCSLIYKNIFFYYCIHMNSVIPLYIYMHIYSTYTLNICDRHEFFIRM
jgi:hypothetical protein